MVQFVTTQRPPFSVLEADARFRRAETMPPERLQRIVSRVVDEIEDDYLARIRAAEAAEMSAWTPFLGECDDN